ncbi:DUF4158 domain-containing protein [Streptomyces sp. NPDC087894]|uniref:DUF4158 domain-containing protein n=1 Tax=Streptomyces sp. NPDC087894 TaxID=3365816 RepID=UPI0037FB0585
MIESRRLAHIRLGFTAQRTIARHLGVLLDDPADVPPEAVDYLAEQLDMGDPSVLSKSGSDSDTFSTGRSYAHTRRRQSWTPPAASLYAGAGHLGERLPDPGTISVEQLQQARAELRG